MVVPEMVKSLLLREEKGSFPVVAMFTTIGSPSFLAVRVRVLPSAESCAPLYALTSSPLIFVTFVLKVSVTAVLPTR